VLAGRFESRPDAPPAPTPPAVTIRPRVHLAWPVEIHARDGELELVDSAEGLLVYRAFEAREPALELPPTDPGRYVLGVWAQGRGGRSFAAVVSEPLELEPGFHELWLDLRPTESLRVRALGPGTSRLYCELRDEWGELVSVRHGVRTFARRFPLDDEGLLNLRHAPVGALRVWLGSEDELDEGRFRMERLIELREGETGELVFDLRR
jgi:hypothetical protein